MVGAIIGMVALLAIGIPSYFLIKRQLQYAPLVNAAKARFEQRVGYAYGGPQSILAVDCGTRKLAEGELSFDCQKRKEGNTLVTTQNWLLKPPTPPRVRFRLVSKELTGAGRALKNLLGPWSVRWEKQSASAHVVGDMRLDGRFTLYTDDPEAARSALLRPEVVSAIDSFFSLMLFVDNDCIGIADPADANLWAAYKAAGLSMAAINAAPMIDVAADVHLSVQNLLSITARHCV